MQTIFMKYLLSLSLSFFSLLVDYSQSSLSIKKLERSFKTVNTIKDFKGLIDGDVVSAICSLLGGGTVCELLSVTPLNEGENETIRKIRTKLEFEKFLTTKGVKADDFYLKLWLNKKNETILDRLNFLKANSH